MSETISPAERLELAWALAWPCALLEFVQNLLLGQLRLTEDQRQNIEQVAGLLAFLLISTWVVRRTVRLDFSGFHLLVIRADAQDGTRTMTYRESLSVAWLISWRSALVLVPFFVTFLLVMDAPPRHGWLLHSVLTVAEFLTFYLWMVNGALNKNYARFSLRLVRSAKNSGLVQVSA